MEEDIKNNIYSIQVICGDCQSPGLFILHKIEGLRVEKKVSDIELILQKRLPECDSCNKKPSKYKFVIKNQDNKVIPLSKFITSNEDTITT